MVGSSGRRNTPKSGTDQTGDLSRTITQHLKHRLIAQFHNIQIHEHEHRPPRYKNGRNAAHEKADPAKSTKSVRQLPEPLSPSYRNRVPKLSTTYRSHSVNYEPELHTISPHALPNHRGKWWYFLVHGGQSPTLLSPG
jgi:hypothetical protein